MFLRAGCTRFRTVCRGVVARFEFGVGVLWRRPSRLVRFASGEYAWVGRGGQASWPEHVLIASFIPHVHGDHPRSPLP